MDTFAEWTLVSQVELPQLPPPPPAWDWLQRELWLKQGSPWPFAVATRIASLLQRDNSVTVRLPSCAMSTLNLAVRCSSSRPSTGSVTSTSW